MTLPFAQPPADLSDIFPGDSGVARLMRAHDWAATPLGPPEAWPKGLTVPLRMMLTSRFEMWLGWGPDVTFFYNDAYAPTLGVKHPTALGRPMRDVWREIFADVEDRVMSVIRDGRATWDKALLLLLERNGYPEETYHTFSYSPLAGDGGAVEGLMCVVTEETERVISERRLATLRALADALLGTLTREAVLAGVDATLATNRRDFPFSLIYLRADSGAWVGHTSTEAFQPLLARDWPMPEHADGATGLRMALPEAGEALPCGDWDTPPREALVVPVARSTADEPFAALVLGLNPFRPEDPELGSFAQLIAGQIAGAIANADALESERRRADRLWVNARDLMVVIGADGAVRSVSPSWTRLLGHPPDQVVGRAFLDFVHPDDAEMTRGGLAGAARHDDLAAFENRCVAISGEVHWVSWHITDENGLVYAYGRDITERKRQAEALQAVEDALRQSQKMEAVGQLTGGLAHDFNNLLTGITGSLEMLQTRIAQGRLGDDLTRYILAAQGAAKRATALTHRLLAFSRRQTLAPKPLNINRLVAGMEDLIRRTVGPAVRTETIAAGGLWATLADPNQLENALLNLCINARDAMPDGGRLTVETANIWFDERAARGRDLTPGQYVSLCVSDSGAGMTPEVMRRAFDPFFTTKPIGQGTGLGLSMVYGFVRQSGGQVRIYSEPGHGTMICLYLPRHLGEAEIDDPAVETADPPRGGGGHTVLVVDDEPTIRMLIADVLDECGCSAIEVEDGAAGLNVLHSDRRIDLLVTDVGLPGGMNGRQMADAGRAVRPDLKVLFITGYAENAVLSHGHLAPGMHVLTKPFPMEVLANRIKDLLA